MTSPEETPGKLSERASDLVVAIRTLNGSVDDLTKKQTSQARVIRGLKKVSRWLIVSIAALLVLSVAATFIVFKQIELDHSLNRQQSEVLCPLLGLFLASYRPELQPPDQREFYESAFVQIRRMNTVLECPKKPT